ncbi:uncharacterized protein LAESUDRAFT_292124 [Laetiporus sulphureus 93-53]|uniref:Zn(2)-C6 fungal-type domain-containing protein n=1 Tax=Laetiporus sulphureus 93-53 TaxID=1314785 RepID=A0A165DEB0_9APHY|nr:uncharacterized protein LAESUDRAFT_292124 [Laetiporus sulphureus 93-53]KZT04693.1 hypothetical protein LAESUDRAFT_292124 [Laetiporus sulphureus 93-53]
MATPSPYSATKSTGGTRNCSQARPCDRCRRNNVKCILNTAEWARCVLCMLSSKSCSLAPKYANGRSAKGNAANQVQKRYQQLCAELLSQGSTFDELPPSPETVPGPMSGPWKDGKTKAEVQEPSLSEPACKRAGAKSRAKGKANASAQGEQVNGNASKKRPHKAAVKKEAVQVPVSSLPAEAERAPHMASEGSSPRAVISQQSPAVPSSDVNGAPTATSSSLKRRIVPVLTISDSDSDDLYDVTEFRRPFKLQRFGSSNGECILSKQAAKVEPVAESISSSSRPAALTASGSNSTAVTAPVHNVRPVQPAPLSPVYPASVPGIFTYRDLAEGGLDSETQGSSQHVLKGLVSRETIANNKGKGKARETDDSARPDADAVSNTASKAPNGKSTDVKARTKTKAATASSSNSRPTIRIPPLRIPAAKTAAARPGEQNGDIAASIAVATNTAAATVVANGVTGTKAATSAQTQAGELSAAKHSVTTTRIEPILLSPISSNAAAPAKTGSSVQGPMPVPMSISASQLSEAFGGASVPSVRSVGADKVVIRQPSPKKSAKTVEREPHQFGDDRPPVNSPPIASSSSAPAAIQSITHHPQPGDTQPVTPLPGASAAAPPADTEPQNVRDLRNMLLEERVHALQFRVRCLEERLEHAERKHEDRIRLLERQHDERVRQLERQSEERLRLFERSVEARLHGLETREKAVQEGAQTALGLAQATMKEVVRASEGRIGAIEGLLKAAVSGSASASGIQDQCEEGLREGQSGPSRLASTSAAGGQT